MKTKFSFFEILILVWATVIPATMSALIVLVYLEELHKTTFIDSTSMKIALVVSVLHSVIMLGIVTGSIFNDFKKFKKIRSCRKHPEGTGKDKHFEEPNKLLEELDKKTNEEKEKENK